MQEVQPNFAMTWGLVHATQMCQQTTALCCSRHAPYMETLSSDNNIVRLSSHSLHLYRHLHWHTTNSALSFKIKWVWPWEGGSFSSYLREIRFPRILHWCGYLNGNFAASSLRYMFRRASWLKWLILGTCRFRIPAGTSTIPTFFFPLNLSVIIPGYSLKLCRYRFSPCPFKFIIHYHI
jgi:hypothetical protein